MHDHSTRRGRPKQTPEIKAARILAGKLSETGQVSEDTRMFAAPARKLAAAILNGDVAVPEVGWKLSEYLALHPVPKSGILATPFLQGFKDYGKRTGLPGYSFVTHRQLATYLRTAGLAPKRVAAGILWLPATQLPTGTKPAEALEVLNFVRSCPIPERGIPAEDLRDRINAHLTATDPDTAPISNRKLFPILESAGLSRKRVTAGMVWLPAEPDSLAVATA